MPASSLKDQRQINLDVEIPKLINKYCMGADVWYMCYPATLTTQTGSFYPGIQIVLGMRGHLLGAAGNVYYFGATDYLVVNPAVLDQLIKNGCENLREQKAEQFKAAQEAAQSQLNGGKPGLPELPGLN